MRAVAVFAQEVNMSKARAYFDLTAAMVIVGSMTAAGKLILVEFPIHLSMGLRFLVATVLALLWQRLAEGGLPRVSRRTLGLLALQAFCGVYLTNALMLWGLMHTSALAAGIITATTPAAMAILALLFLREHITRQMGLGVIVAVAGIMVLNVTSLERAGNAGLFGNLLMLAVVFAESGFLLIRKGIRENLTPLTATTYVSIIGLLIFLPPAAVEAVSFDFAAVSLSGWLLIVYYGAIVSVAAYFFWFRGVVDVAASTAGIFTAVMPLSAVFFSVVVVGERLGLEHVAGCGLVVVAIWCICRSGSKSC